MLRLGCLSFLVVTASSGAALAQGLYLPDGASGIGVAGGVSGGDTGTALSVGAGYSYRTFIDAGVAGHYYSFPKSDTGSYNITAFGVQPYVTVHALRQGGNVPVSLAATANYQHYFYSVTDNALDISGWSMFVGGSAYRRFGLSGPWSVTPQVTFGLSYLRSTGGQSYVPGSRGDAAPLIELAGNFAYEDRGGRIWTGNPFIAFGNGAATFGIAIGGTLALRRPPPPAATVAPEETPPP